MSFRKKEIPEVCRVPPKEISSINFLSLFRYASKSDLCLIAVGIIFTCVKSLVVPLTIIVFCEFASLCVDRTYGIALVGTRFYEFNAVVIGTSSPTPILSYFQGGKILTNRTIDENEVELVNDAYAYAKVMLIVSCLQFVGSFLGVHCFNRAAIPQLTRIRCKYFEALMRQEVRWYDTENRKPNVAVCLTKDIDKIKNGINEKVSQFLYTVLSFIFSLLIAFIYGWKLALIAFAYLPILFVTHIVITKLQRRLKIEELDDYAAAASIAEEVLSGIRTVFAFSGEKIEAERYSKQLSPAKPASRRRGLLCGVENAALRFFLFTTAALIFWFGARWVLDDRGNVDKEYTAAVLMIVFFSLTIGTESIAKITSYLEIFATARNTAAHVFQVIERKSSIDALLENAKVDEFEVNGNIEFKNVYFSHPLQSDVTLLNDFNLTIETGQSVALVGDVKSEQSACLHLLQRFHDPNEGEILMNGRDIRSLDIHQWRSKIALVDQEPILFSTTISENIRCGKPDATEEEIVEAARNSGAHDFISRLPLGYNTLGGEKDSQLSVDQKQRITIARALIQNPKILLLDEATSALDYQSEKFVQETLDRASKGRTTIVVSRRLSAIRNADRILFIDKGQVVEDGTHNELLEQKGRYHDMILIGGLEDATDSFMEKNDMTKNSNKPEESIDDSSNCQKPLIASHGKPEIAANFGRRVRKFLRILKLAKPDWDILIVAIACALIIGANLPLFSIYSAQIFDILSTKDRDEAVRYTFKLVVKLICLGVLMFLAAISQSFFFSKVGDNLTVKLRSMAFASMLKQECGWFDDRKNSVGTLSTRLREDAAQAQGVIGLPLSMILQSASTVASGMILGFHSSFKISFYCIFPLLLIVICIFLGKRHMFKSKNAENIAIEAGIKIATEACSNIQTVASLRQESNMISRFVAEMKKTEQIIKTKIRWRSLVISLKQTIPLVQIFLAVFFGGLLIANGEITNTDVIRACLINLYVAYMMTHIVALAPAFTAALVATDRVFEIIDREPQIQSPIVANRSRKAARGNDIKFEQIGFRYPKRPHIQILNNFNLNIAEGQTIALVGPSGCGKSACIQLLQRFYDPEHGRIYIGLDEISSDISLNDLRSKLGIISQEPDLFNKTIAENIAYGDNSRKVPMTEIIEAAKAANIHNFIIQLSSGYETNLGSKGAHLSGSEKQRIAIARALIRNPKILLLDEVTAALDLRSEQVVEQVLATARSGRTCIITAHRLRAVEKADLICVMRNGSIVEAGTHNQLLAMNGFYARLYNVQK